MCVCVAGRLDVDLLVCEKENMEVLVICMNGTTIKVCSFIIAEL